jgi:negative regulator of flagellin synthesis FlgM
MQIHHLQSSAAVQSLNRSAPPKSAGPAASAAATSPLTDQLDLSPEAQAIGQTGSIGSSQATSGIRSEKVDALRQAIQSGTYETPEKLSAALDRLLDSFA